MKRYSITDASDLNCPQMMLQVSVSGEWVKWDDVKELCKKECPFFKITEPEDKCGTIPTEEFKKEDIKKVDGTPTIAWGDFYINGKDIDQLINKMADDIKRKLSDSTLMGQKIDLTNPNQCLLAAYEMGRTEELNNHIGVMRTMRLLRERGKHE